MKLGAYLDMFDDKPGGVRPLFRVLTFILIFYILFALSYLLFIFL